jgi:hypothetical protein
MFGGKLAGRSRHARHTSVTAETRKLRLDQAWVDLMQCREAKLGAAINLGR